VVAAGPSGETRRSTWGPQPDAWKNRAVQCMSQGDSIGFADSHWLQGKCVRINHLVTGGFQYDFTESQAASSTHFQFVKIAAVGLLKKIFKV
jgi:hypothetical protein